jgi:hypothetical protein
LLVKLRILHAVSIVADIFGALQGLFVLSRLAIQRPQETLQAALVKFVIAPLNPFLALLTVTIDEFADLAEVLFGMKTVQDLNGLREQFRSRVPDPGRTIA